MGPNVVVRDPAEAAVAVVPRMRAAGAQVVIVLSHLPWPDSEALAAAVAGIDVILGDHESTAIDQAKVINGTIVSRRGDEFDRLAILTLIVRDGRVVDHRYSTLPVTQNSPVSASVQEVVDRYRALLSAELDVEIGATAVDLEARRDFVRGRETNLGKFVADAMRMATGADVAIMNGGSIRGDRVHPPGPLTRGTVVEILPFSNYLAVLRLSGAELLEALENGVSRVPQGDGRFPQVSGLTFEFDPAAPPMARVAGVWIGGAPLDPDARYTVATNDFMAGGGDGYTVFRGAEVLVPGTGGPLLTNVVIDAVGRVGTIAPQVEGRILILGQAGAGVHAGCCVVRAA